MKSDKLIVIDKEKGFKLNLKKYEEEFSYSRVLLLEFEMGGIDFVFGHNGLRPDEDIIYNENGLLIIIQDRGNPNFDRSGSASSLLTYFYIHYITKNMGKRNWRGLADGSIYSINYHKVFDYIDYYHSEQLGVTRRREICITKDINLYGIKYDWNYLNYVALSWKEYVDKELKFDEYEKI